MFAVPIYFHFFLQLLFWLMIFSLVSRCFCFRKAYDSVLFLLPFVSFCCMHLYFMFTAVSYQMFFH